VTTGTRGETHLEVLSQAGCSSDLASSDFCLFGPFKEILGRKGFRADDEDKLLCKDDWTSNHKLS
jgi:hypothetical protein